MKNTIDSSIFIIALLFAVSGCSDHITKPNVLLLTLDTLRADALGCYGNPTIKTPTLDRLAREGALFEDVTCQIPATLSSHTAILTGRNPKTTGVRFRTAHVSEHEETLAERFTSHGYDTAAFISSIVLAPHFGLNQGFVTYSMGSLSEEENNKISERRAAETVDDAIAYLTKNQNKPFFLWVHLYDPHSPYNAPEPYKSMYDPDYKGSFQGTVAEITRLTATQGAEANQRDLRHLRALYHGEVTYMDKQIERIISGLEKYKLLDNTVIAAIADHGESLGEKGRFFHGDDLYQPAVKIPLILRFPQKIKQGIRIDEHVQSIDLFPTLLQLTNVPEISGVEGQSLLSLISNGTTNAGEPYHLKPAFLENEADILCDSNKLYGIRTNEYKFIHHSAHRRSDTPLGVMAEIPLKGPTIVMLRIEGDPSIRLMAHIRYRTEALYQSRDYPALAKLNTTIVHAESWGTDPLHQQAKTQDTFLPTPEGWRLQATPDLYPLARNYGLARDWPVDWMVLEGVGVDAAIPFNQTTATFTVDQIELFAPQLRFPNSPKFRNPFWILEDFEGTSQGMADAQAGPAHTIHSQWSQESLFGETRQQQITITFADSPNSDDLDELYDMENDPGEEKNLLPQSKELSKNCRLLLQQWIVSETGTYEFIELSPSQREALEALGYTR